MKFIRLLPIVLAFAAGACQAHARLESSEPKADSTLAAAPKAVRLQFNEAVEPAFSRIGLRGPAGREISLPKPSVPRPNEMTVPLPALAPGEYQLQWSTVTHDGHKVKGGFTFRVR